MTNYPTCDHPELLVKDNRCLVCQELNGQLDVLDEVER